MICVNYGCGFSAPDSWLNYDASMTLRFERIPFLGRLYTKNSKRFPKNIRYGDIVKGLPLSNNSVDMVFCSHMLEHLSLNDFRMALKNTLNILKEGGVFRLVVPDLKQLAENYLNSNDEDASIQFVRNTLMGEEGRSQGLRSAAFNLLGNSKHLWMWDFISVQYELDLAGFVMIRECKYGDADDAMFKLVEDENRFMQAVCVECRK